MQAVFITLNNVYPLVSSLSKALRRSSASFFFAKRSWKTVPGWALTVILELFLFHQHKIVKMESVGASKALTRASCAIDVLCLSESRPYF